MVLRTALTCIAATATASEVKRSEQSEMKKIDYKNFTFFGSTI
jgi:hypothetical protein